MRKHFIGEFICTSFLALVLGAVAPARGDIFVANNHGTTVGQYTNSGATINSSLITGLVNPTGLVVSGTDLYVVNGKGDVAGAGTIGKYNTSGGVVNTALVSGLTAPDGLALVGSNLYVTNASIGTVGEYNAITGAAVSTSLISGLNFPTGIVASGSNLFVMDYGIGGSNGKIGVYDATTGAAINANLVTGLSFTIGIAISGSNLYVTNSLGTTKEYTTAGALVNTFSPVGSNNWGVAIAGNTMLISRTDTGTVSSYDATTGALVNNTLISGLNYPTGIVVTPEPAALSLLALGGVSLLMRRRRRA